VIPHILEEGETVYVRPQPRTPKRLWNLKGKITKRHNIDSFDVEIEEHDDIYLFSRGEIYTASEY
jgi:hypothetical protein